MHRTLASFTVLALLTAVAAAQPEPTPPADPPAADGAPATAPATPEVATPEVPPEAAAPVVHESEGATAGYDKGFFIRSDDGKFALKIGGRVHAFYVLTRESGPKDYRSQFDVRRARLVLEGSLRGKDLTFKLQTDYDRGLAGLKDVYVDLALRKDMWLRIGQWKVPFSRQRIASSGRQELTDRAITDKAFGAGRDVGLALGNKYEKSPDFEWIVGVFNGVGELPKLTGTVTVDPMTNIGTIGPTKSSNVPTKFKPAVIARAGINRNGLKGYSEADLEGGPLRYGVAASLWLEGDFDDNDQSAQRAELDYMVKASGFSTTGGVYAATEQTDVKLADAELSLVGFHLQAGYMVDKRWQVAARYAMVNDPRQKASAAVDQQEISIGGNYFGPDHDTKVAGAIRFIKTGVAGFTDVVLFELGTNLIW